MKRKLYWMIPLILVVLAAMLAIPALALTSTTNQVVAMGSPPVGSSTLLGDVNNDGTINGSDAMLVLRHALQIITLSDNQIAAADCNGDGNADVVDALIIMCYCIGIPMPEPEPATPTEPTIIVDNATASAGDTVTVTVRIVNNPGVAGAVLRLSYDSNLTLTGAASGEAFSYLQYTRPGQYSNPCNFSWDSESGMATDDGTILTLTFRVSDSVSSGDKLNVNISYTHGDIYDENLDDVDLDIINSHITIN